VQPIDFAASAAHAGESRDEVFGLVVTRVAQGGRRRAGRGAMSHH